MKQKFLIILFALIICTGWLNPLPASAWVPDVCYVSPAGSNEFGNGSQIWADSDNSTDWSLGDTGPWLTIKHAADLAAAGATINVAAGTYHENIILTKPVTLLGPNVDIDPNTSLRYPEAVWQSDNSGSWPLRTISLSFDGGPVIYDITIKGFSFTGRPDVTNTAGIVQAQEKSKGTPVTTNNVVIENNIFTGFANGVKSMGIYKTSGNAFLRSSGWQIRNNRFENFSDAAAMQVGSITNSAVSGNVLLNTCGGIDLDRVDNFLCSGNTLTNIVKKGINLASPSSDVIISQNRITNANTAHNSGEGGIALWASDFTGPVNVTGNTITSCWNALAVADDRGNFTHDFIHVNRNHFSLNSNLNVYLPAGATGVLDCTGNWFGTNISSEIAATVSAGVDHSPWWGADYVADAHTGAWDWYTNDSIQEAIETAADGDTITIAAGIYDENIDINRRLTLQGAGHDDITGTILQNTAAPALIKGSPYSYKPVVVISTSGVEDSPIVLKGLLIRTHQDNVTGAQLPGILPRPGIQISWLELDNVRICGTRSSGTTESGVLLDDFSSLEHVIINDSVFENMAYGIIFFNNSNTGTNARDIEINRSTFNRNSIKGFYAEKLSDAVFNEVTVTDNGDTSLSPDWADPVNAGIDINLKYGDYANLTFNDLTVTGNGVGSDNGTGLAVKARGTGMDVASYSSRPATLAGVTIKGGTFTGNRVGIRFGQLDKQNTVPSGISVHYAAVSGNLAGGMENNLDGITVDATGNWWGTVNQAEIAGQCRGDIVNDPWHLKAPTAPSAGQAACDAVVLAWTGGGIWKGDRYDFRYDTSPLDTPATWTKAKCMSGEPVPENTAQQMLVKGLQPGTKYYFGLSVVDGELRSGISYLEASTLSTNAPDHTAPAAVTSLAVSAGDPASSSVLLTWTATGDDGDTGFARKYIIKQSTSPIDDGNFAAADTVHNKLSPAAGGETESFTVGRLKPGTLYYFAIKVQDEIPNTSPVSNVVSLATTARVPLVTGLNPPDGDNGRDRTLISTGCNFAAGGAAVVCLVGRENVLSLADVNVISDSEITATVATGTPPGSYYVRISNAYGTSLLSTAAYTVHALPEPLPVVTNLIPGIAVSGHPQAGVRLYGANFAGAAAVALSGHTAAGFTVNSSTFITADFPALTEGTYDVQVTTAAGTNTVSTVKYTVMAPEPAGLEGGQEISTAGIIEPGAGGTIPVQVTLTTAAGAVPDSGMEAAVEVVIPPGTALTDAAGQIYGGVIYPPRIVKPDTEMQSTLPPTAVVIEMGNPEQQVSFSQDFTAVVTVAAGSRPYIYYRNKLTGHYELAGKSGTVDGTAYEPGGTVLGLAGEMYTIGLLLDHMSVYVASTTSLLPAPLPAVPVVNYLQADFCGTRTFYSLDLNGKAVSDIKLVSADGRLSLSIPAGAQARDHKGLPLASLTGTVNDSPPATPTGASIIGTAYNFGPTGAVFSPYAVLEYDYTNDTLPAVISDEALVWAYYDEATGVWMYLDCTLDTTRHTITAEIAHFTTFAVLSIPPAVFTSSSLSVSPAAVAPGQAVTITAAVVNNGSSAGRHTSILVINGVKTTEIPLDLAAGERRTVVFTVTREIPGEYHVDIDGLAGIFTVTAPQAPAPAAFSVTNLTIDVPESHPGSTIKVSVTLANTGGTPGSYILALRINGVPVEEKAVDLAAGENRTVVFTVVRDEPGIYQVAAGSLAGSFTISGNTSGRINWLLTAAIGIVLVVIILIILLLRKRRQASKA